MLHSSPERTDPFGIEVGERDDVFSRYDERVPMDERRPIQERHDLVVGADGVRSWTRRALDINLETKSVGMGIWRAFGPRPASEGHPHPRSPVEPAPGELAMVPICLGSLRWGLEEKRGRARDFCCFAATATGTRHVSGPVDIQTYLWALDGAPVPPKEPPAGGVFQA